MSSTLPSLPPPPPPPSSPKVARRDPKTMLRQPPRKWVVSSDTWINSSALFSVGAELGEHNTVGSDSVSPKQTDINDMSTSVTDLDFPAGLEKTDSWTVACSDHPEKQITKSPILTSSPKTQTNVQPTRSTPVSRPVPFKNSPTFTDRVRDYQRQHSLPGCMITTTIFDCRSVVTSEPTSRDLIPAANSDSSVQAAVAAALSQSLACSDDIPQWIPPNNPENSTHSVRAPTSDYAGTVPVYGIRSH
ncbi:hypothetical protein D915_009298 [Fasciola hepatica]|uniref:Uncharacterized protein n=1 Tax=Fasciola hepatica TaxID=6192 RepID=A0A4E0RFT2_FASHE|nr:hypothetical protein D915_009298 [Fasciola hepatica]